MDNSCDRCDRVATTLYSDPLQRTESYSKTLHICGYCVVQTNGVLTSVIHGSHFSVVVLFKTRTERHSPDAKVPKVVCWTFHFCQGESVEHTVIPRLLQFLYGLAGLDLSNVESTQVAMQASRFIDNDNWQTVVNPTPAEIEACWSMDGCGNGCYLPDLWPTKLNLDYDVETGFLRRPDFYIFMNNAMHLFRFMAKHLKEHTSDSIGNASKNNLAMMKPICVRARQLLDYAIEQSLCVIRS